MATSCRITPHVTNPQGEEVPSKLYTDLKNLMSYVGQGDRASVLPLYQKTLDPRFKKDMEDKGATLDENGEITLYDYWNFTDAGAQIPESVVIQYLNESNNFFTKNEQTKFNSQEKVFDAVEAFNDSIWSRRFTAKIKKQGKSYTVSIEPSDSNYKRRVKYYSRFTKRLAKLLEGWGIAVDDIEQLEDAFTNGFIDFNDIGRLPDGLIHLIKLAKGSKGDFALPEEFAHFVVRSLRNSPLISRALNQLLQNEAYKTVLGEDYARYAREYNNDPNLLAEEALGKILAQKFENAWVHQDLLTRIKNLFKKLFGKFDEQKIKQIALDADQDLNVLAEDILKGKYENLQTTDLGNDKLLQAEENQQKIVSRWDQFFENTLKRVAIYQKRRRDLILTSEDATDKEAILDEQNELLQQLETAAHYFDENAFYVERDLEGHVTTVYNKEQYRMQTAINMMKAAKADTKRILDIVNELKDQIDHNTYKGSLNSACAKIRAILDYLDSYEQLIEDWNYYKEDFFAEDNIEDLIQDLSPSEAVAARAEYARIKKELDDHVATINDTMGKIRTAVIPRAKDYNLNDKEYKPPLAMKVFIKGLRDLFPEDAVLVVGHKLNGEVVTLEELFMFAEDDISGATAWLNAMANTSDDIARIYDFIVKKQKGEARQECLAIQRRIKAAGKKLEGFGFSGRDHSWMYAKYADDVVDNEGNVIHKKGEYILDNFGRPMYIKNYDKQAADKAYREFLQSLYHQYGGLPLAEQDEKIKAEKEKWFAENYEYRNGQSYPKAKKFPSKEYEALTDAQKEFYDVFMDCKRQLDKYLPVHTMDSTSAIIVRKSALQRILTLKASDINFKDLGQQIRDLWSDLFHRKATDDEYGTTPTLMNFRGKEVKRIPIYYTQIDPNANLNNYSTNMIANMCLYAETATKYKALAKVIETLELGRDLIQLRKTNKKEGEKKLIAIVKAGARKLEEMVYLDQNETNFTKRLNNFMDMQVYGALKVGKTSKLAALAARIVGLFTTAISVYVGITNVMQGLGQINIEMFAGEHFNMRNLLRAKTYYWTHILHHIWEIGSMTKTDMMSLFSEDFNVMQEFESNTKDLKSYERNRLARLFGSEALYWLNHIGEHYMQHLTFFALADNEKIYDENGKAISVLDAYESKAIDPNHPSHGKYLALKSRNYTTKDGKKIVSMEELKERQEKNKKEGHNYDLYSKKLLEPNEVAEYDFKNRISRKSAKLNQDMHGIYNEEDKNMLQQKAWGGLFMMYRKHIMPNLMKRWKGEYYDYALETNTLGYQRDFYKRILPDLPKLFMTSKDEDGGFKWKWLSLPKQERANAGRIVGQLFNYGLNNLLITLMENYSDDDDDSLWFQILLVSLYRAKTENTMFEALSLFNRYNFLSEWLRLIDQPVVGTSIAESAINLCQLMNPEVWTTEVQRGRFAGDLKGIAIIKKNIPGFRQIIDFKKPPIDYYRRSVGTDPVVDVLFKDEL